MHDAMRSVHDGWETFDEPYEEQVGANRYNPAQKIKFRDKAGKHEHTLSAGSEDTIYVFRSGTVTYVLAYNYRLQYAGLEAFEGDRAIGDIFVQSDWDMVEILGPKGLDLTPITIAKRLAERIE